MNFIEKLRARHAALTAERAALKTEDDAITTLVETENRDTLTEAETTRHKEIIARNTAIVAELDQIEADIAEREALDDERSALPKGRNFVPRQPDPDGDARRNLDALLWASDETVRAGSFDKAGSFRYSGAVNPVEQTMIRSLDGDQVPAPRITEYRPEERDAIRNFQKTVADMAIFGLLVDRSAKTSKDGFQVARGHKLFKDRWNSVLRALDVDTSGEGGNWVPTGIGSSLHEKVRAAGKVAPLFARVNMPTNPWKWPVEGSDATAYRVAEPTADNASKVAASTPGTVAPTFDAEIFGARTLFSRSVDADSALAILPFANRKLVIAFMTAEEMAILDGDTDGTHQDTDVHALGTTDARWAWDGLRKKAIAQTLPAVAQTATSVANLILIRKAMGKWGVNPGDLAYIVGVSALHTLIGDTSLLTVDKMGPQATILNGMVGSIAGVPVIVSEYVREDLNATGVNDGITATKTYNLCVNRNEWAFGQREALDIEVDDSIYRESYQRVVVGFQREDFQHIGDAATNDDTALAYNITP